MMIFATSASYHVPPSRYSYATSVHSVLHYVAEIASLNIYIYKNHWIQQFGMWWLSFGRCIVPFGTRELNEGSWTYEGISKSFRTGRLERELQMVQLPATKCSCIIILSVSLVSFAAITLCVPVYYCCLFRYRLSPETFGYTLVPGFYSSRTPRRPQHLFRPIQEDPRKYNISSDGKTL
jgi:hypothetical protein